MDEYYTRSYSRCIYVINKFQFWISILSNFNYFVVFKHIPSFCVESSLQTVFLYLFLKVLISGSPYQYIFSWGRLNKHEFVRQQVRHCGSSFVSGHSLSVDRSVTQHAVNEKMLTSHTLPGFIHPGTDGRSVAEAWRPSLLHVVSEPLPSPLCRRSVRTFNEFHWSTEA